jgi:hypothetical protein
MRVRARLCSCIDTVYCCKPIEICHPSRTEVYVDAIITTAALAARILMLCLSGSTLVADGHVSVVCIEVVGVLASTIHFTLRVFVLARTKGGELPITKLGGPMSIADATSAVLLTFADPPLLSTHDGRFAAVGRMLIGLLISISVLTTCMFSSAMCAMLSTCLRCKTRTGIAENAESQGGYTDYMAGYKELLTVSAVLWVLQGMSCTSALCAIFVNPASFSITRMQTGNTTPVKYCIFFGVLCSCLPTINKISLLLLQQQRTA